MQKCRNEAFFRLIKIMGIYRMHQITLLHLSVIIEL